jgi:3-oxoacyl-[acyl-carrier protein] reductase
MEDIKSIDLFLGKIGDVDEIAFFTSTISNTLILEKFEKISPEAFESEFKINFFNYLYLLQKIIPKMKNNSNVVFILSEMVLNPQKNFSPYITSKYAVLGLMKCLAKEFASEKVRFNAVSPSKMNTDFLWKVNLNSKTVYVPNAIKEKQLQTQKFLPPDKVAEKIISILNDSSINGQNFIIND